MPHECGDTTELVRETEGNRRVSRGRKFCFGAVMLFSLWGPSTLSAQNQNSLGDVARQRKAESRPAPKAGTAQSTSQQPDLAWLQDAMKDRELMSELGQLMEKLQKGISYPAARNQSRILPRLSGSTLFYVALPNYGETVHQAFDLFQQGLNDSPHLRAFLKKNNFEAVQPAIQNGVQKFYEVSEYLGDEVVITGSLQGREPGGVLVAEVKKPGLREVLERLNSEVFTNAGDRLRIFDPQQLATGGETGSHAPAVLIRPDYIAFGLSVASLRDFNAQLDQRGSGFASRPLGQRLTKSYQQGTNTVAGLDLHQLISLMPMTKPQDRAMLEKTGIADVNYVVMESTLSGEGSKNQGEITFNGPRHGIASWLAAPAPMGGLDFVSSNTAMALAVILKNPSLMFDDLRGIMGETAFASLPQMEAQLKVNLKRDLLSRLTGEIVLEAPAPSMMVPVSVPTTTTFAPDAPLKTGPFKLILGVSDATGLQQTLTQLLATVPMRTAERREEGVTIHTITIPGAAGNAQEINYFFLDGYLVIASDQAVAEESLRAHRTGTSLARSSKLRDSLSRGPSSNASMIVYQNAGQMMAPMMAQLPPELRQLMPAGTINTAPNVFSVYADETALRGFANNNVQTDATVGLIIAAIAIPNFVRARQEAANANDGAALSSIRTVNMAQVTYTATYPERGFAAGLALLGPGTGGDCSTTNPTSEHACLLDGVLANVSCTSGRWCEKGGYKFSVRGVCLAGRCASYVVTATPVNVNGLGKNFCSTEDAVIRSHSGPSLAMPLTANECKAWMPIR